jgi:two-component system response regulator AtoC
MSSKLPSVLLIDDEPSVCEALELALEDHFQVTACGSAEAGIELLDKNVYAVVVCDIGLPGASGESLLASVKSAWPGTEVVMLTAARDVQQAVRCMRIGSYDYITKPWDVEELRAIVGRAAEKWRISTENTLLRQGQSSSRSREILGGSKAMQQLRELITRVAAHDAVALIHGESGTGKELVAQSIHAQSARRRERFVAIGCGSMPADLVESELFGHEKGAFSSAYATRIGKFEYASGGTLFLDDVAVLPMSAQTKLLRVLQEREVSRLGSNRVIPVDVRVLSSTNVDLLEQVRKGLFREDLYWRLSGVPLRVPPLREREGDVEELLAHFLAEAAALHQRKVPAVSESVLKALRSHPFPGNVRELKHLAETLLVLCDNDTIGVSALPIQMILPSLGKPLTNVPLKDAVREFERQVIVRTLRTTRGNQSRAADLLGIHRNTLLIKMSEMGIAGRLAAHALVDDPQLTEPHLR